MNNHVHIINIIMLGAKYGFAQFMDCACIPRIALRAQTTDRLVYSQVQSKDKLQVSGIALAS